MPDLEPSPEEVYDRAMVDRDPAEFGWNWTPWSDLDQATRDYWSELAAKRRSAPDA